jgi:hypothetical protein
MSQVKFEFACPVMTRVVDLPYSSLGDNTWLGSIYVDESENPYVDESGTQYTSDSDNE